MTVFIHPTACSPAKISALQTATGMRAVIGRTYGRLILPNSKPARAGSNKPKFYPAYGNGPQTDGAA
jgi:hypothetical protein